MPKSVVGYGGSAVASAGLNNGSGFVDAYFYDNAALALPVVLHAGCDDETAVVEVEVYGSAAAASFSVVGGIGASVE